MADRFTRDATYSGHIQDVVYLIQKMRAEGATRCELEHRNAGVSLVIYFREDGR